MNGEGLNLEDIIGEVSDNGKEDSSNNYIPENIVEITKPCIENISFKENLFQEGVDSVSVLCGAITALVNIGVTPNKAMDYLTDKEASTDMIVHAENITRIQSDAMVQGAKFETAKAKMESI
jgi:hypothetical protein